MYSHAWINCNWILKPASKSKIRKTYKIIDEIKFFKRLKLRPSRAKFVDAFRWNAVLKRRTEKWGWKFIII